MRADNNWEDKVGKRLYDFEGELSPQAWNNISKKIQPKRRNRWFWWLPLVLVLLSVPAGLYYSGKLKTVLNTEEKPAGNIASNTEPENKVALNSATYTSESVAETNLKVTQPGETKELANNQIEENRTVKTEVKSAAEEKKEQLASNSNNASQTKRPKRKAFVIIPGRETKKAASEEKNAGREKPVTTKQIRQKAFNSPAVLAARTKKNNAGNNAEIKENTTRNKFTRTSNSIALNSGNSASEQKLSVNKSAVNSSGKNSASNKAATDKTAENKTETAKEFGGINSQPEVSKSVTSGSGSEQTGKTAAGKTESSAIKPIAADSLISKADSLAVKSLAKEDSSAKIADPKKKQWAFSIYGTPHYTFQRVTPNENDDTKILRLNNKNDFESERLGYEIGLRAFYPLKEKLQLEFGFQFAHLTQYLSFTTASQFADSAVVYQQGNTVNMNVYNSELKQVYLIKYSLAGLYTGLNKAFGNNLNLNGGIGANWILSSKTVPASTQISNANFTPYLSAGLNYNRALSPKIELQAGPNIQYYLKPLQKKDGLFCTEPTVLGFKVGILFR